MSNFFLGLVIAVIGAAMTMKSDVVYQWLGQIVWAERNLGSGGTRLFIKLLGILIIFLGFTIMVGLWGSILEGTIGALYR